ncbi:membrane protein [Luteococcus sediminum]|uniref:DoxX family protein n=1 Tax=Luteococcus sp. TaxID=1969402 RepID=UPI003734DD73
MSDDATRNAHLLSGLCLCMGLLHFVKPEPFDGLIPSKLPGSPRFWTLASGVAEIATGTLLAVPSTRRLGGLAAQALFVGVFPGNLKMAKDSREASLPVRVISLARLPLQADLIRRARMVSGQE